MEKLRMCVENSDRDGISQMIERHIKDKSGRNLAGIYKAIRKDTDELGKQSFRVQVFQQMVGAVLRFWFEPGVSIVPEALSELLVELLADISLLPAANCSGLCETIVDNLGCPMTLELLSSLLLHASSTAARVPWRAGRVSDLKTALIQAVLDKAPWKDDFVVHIAKFFREIEPTTPQMALISPVLAPYLSSLQGAQLLPLLGHLLPLHPSFLEQILHRLRPQQLDEATRAGVLAQCVAAARHNPGIAKSVQALVRTRPDVILSDAFKFRLCLLVGSIHRTFQGATYGALLRAVALHSDHELKRFDARWLRETLPAKAPLALLEAATLSPSDDRVQLISNCLMDFGFTLLGAKAGARVCREGALMVLTLCQTSSQPATAQLVLDRTLRMHFQNPSHECSDLLAKLPCGQLPASVGWDVISALPSVDPSVSKSLVRVVLRSCPQVRDELVISLRKCLFGGDPASSLIAAKGLLEIVAYFTVDDADVSQNPNGRLCLEALELIRRLLLGNAQSSPEVRRCLLEGLPDLIKENRLLKEAIFELLKEIFTETSGGDPHVLMAISNCLCAYRKTHVKGSPKSRVLKDLYRTMCLLVEQGDPTCLDALVRFSAEFGLDATGIQELLRRSKLNQSSSGGARSGGQSHQDPNESDSSQSSTSGSRPATSTAAASSKKKKGEKSPSAPECLLSNEVLCWLLRTDAVPVEVRVYASDALAQRKQLEPHERYQLLRALKETLTKPYIDIDTKCRCVSLLSINLQAAVSDVFNRQDILEAREELLRELNVDSRSALFRYFQEMVRQANSDTQRAEIDIGPLLACVQCLCLLFPDDAALMADIYSWADEASTEAGITYLPLMLDLSNHIEGGLALLRGLSRRLALLCGLIEANKENQTEAFASLHAEDIPEIFALFNTFIRGIVARLEWVLSKLGLSTTVEARFIKQLYYVVDALATVAHSVVPLEQAEGLFQSAAKTYKVLTSLAKYYCITADEVSPRYPKLVHFVQKTCTPRFEALIMAVEEESTRRNLGKKKKSHQPKAVPGFVFATEQHHLELNKLAKKIDLGNIAAPASARDFKIRVSEVRRHQDEFSDEEIPNSQTVPPVSSDTSKVGSTAKHKGHKAQKRGLDASELKENDTTTMRPPKCAPRKARTEEELRKLPRVAKPTKNSAKPNKKPRGLPDVEPPIMDHGGPLVESIFPPSEDEAETSITRPSSPPVMCSTRISETSSASHRAAPLSAITTPTSTPSSRTAATDNSTIAADIDGSPATRANRSKKGRKASDIEIEEVDEPPKSSKPANEPETAKVPAPSSPPPRKRRRTLGVRAR